MPTITLTENWHGYALPIGDYEFSDEGARVLRNHGEGCFIDDAQERIMSEIDYFEQRVISIEHAQRYILKTALNDPIGTRMDYDSKLSELHHKLELCLRSKRDLCMDLSMLIFAAADMEEVL